MGPLQFEPIIKQIRWGGTRLGSRLGKPIGDLTDAAESWEVADQPDGESIVASGPFCGRSLHELIADHSEDLFGAGVKYSQFPLLIKYLDANDRLSVQVHPNDQQALAYGEHQRGKTEAWVIMDAEEGSVLYAGLKEGVSPENFRAAIEANDMDPVLHSIEVKTGDVVFIPAGTVHAIAEGILLAEVQQQSNLTFRINDWGRMGADGKPRQLHIEDSMKCIDFERGPVSPAEPRSVEGEDGLEELVQCEFFQISRREVTATHRYPPQSEFRILMILDGSGILKCDEELIPLSRGRTILLPATCPQCTLASEEPLNILEVMA